MTERDLTPEKLYGQNKAKFCFNINVPDDIKWMIFINCAVRRNLMMVLDLMPSCE